MKATTKIERQESGRPAPILHGQILPSPCHLPLYMAILYHNYYWQGCCVVIMYMKIPIPGDKFSAVRTAQPLLFCAIIFVHVN